MFVCGAGWLGKQLSILGVQQGTSGTLLLVAHHHELCKATVPLPWSCHLWSFHHSRVLLAASCRMMVKACARSTPGSFTSFRGMHPEAAATPGWIGGGRGVTVCCGLCSLDTRCRTRFQGFGLVSPCIVQPACRPLSNCTEQYCCYLSKQQPPCRYS